MARISLRDIRKTYVGAEVVHGVSFDIADGEFVVIVGPSGCGKSTLLRMVAGLEDISAGTIRIDDTVVNDLEPRARNIAMVFQNYALYPHMTVRENMSYGLKIAGMPKDQIAEKVDRAAAMLELGPFLDRKPRALSGGQRQRVAMGRALVRDPSAFLLDEPLSNLDAKLRVQMRLQIKALQQTVRTTTIYVTHDQVEAMTLADRLVVMNAGVTEQIDTPMNVYESPATVFVAGFIGSPSMNILPAVVSPDGAGVVVAGSVTIPLPGQRLPPAGTALTFGIRPEHAEAVPAEAPGAVPMTVFALETLGADAFAHCQFRDGQPMPDQGFVLRLPGTASLRAGDILSMRIPPEAIHLFDSATGYRL